MPSHPHIAVHPHTHPHIFTHALAFSLASLHTPSHPHTRPYIFTHVLTSSHMSSQVKSVVLINCGACLNVLELLQPDQDDVTFYVVDSRRPYELDNVYSDSQVQLVVREGEELELPAFQEIYDSDMVGQHCLYNYMSLLK